MDSELDALLCRRYPTIFRDRHASENRTAMCWGFACGDGWFGLIDTLCAEIQRRVDTHACEPVVALQVKEKFGALRFYVRGGDDYTAGLIWFADALAGYVCEECGAPALRTGKGWIMTRCAQHDGADFPLDDMTSDPDDPGTEDPRLVSPDRLAAWERAARLRLPPIRTRVWRHIGRALEEIVRNDLRHNQTPGIVIDSLDESGGLAFHWLGGDERGRAAGMFRLAEAYAARCDRRTGKPAY